MLVIRKMEKRDCEAVWRLQNQNFSDGWTLLGLYEMFQVPGYTSFVALTPEDGQLVGYLGMKAVLDEADITNVVVASSVRKQGIGKKLLQEMLTFAAGQGIETIFLEVRQSNKAAITLYEHAAFEKIDVRKNYYENPKEDAVIMKWNRH